MKQLRENLLIKNLWLGMAFFIFNFSIDAPDSFGDIVPENLNINDIESITELVLEDVLGIYNAIPEHDENDLEDEGGFCKKIDFKFNPQECLLLMPSFVIYVKKPISISTKVHFKSPSLKGLIKPPQA